MSHCPHVLIAAPGTVPVRCPWWGGSTPLSPRDAPPLAIPTAGVPGRYPRGPSKGVGSRARGVERKDWALGASEMLPSTREGGARFRQPGGKHDALS
jgi:hypothetical protein